MNEPTRQALQAIIFLNHRNLPAAMQSYDDVLGLQLAIEQGWCKICKYAHGAHQGSVDERWGIIKWSANRPLHLHLHLHVVDVDAWYGHALDKAYEGLSRLFENVALGIRSFVFNDPKGHQIEFQLVTRESA